MKKYLVLAGWVSLTSLVIFFAWGFWQYLLFNKALKAVGGYPLECGYVTTVATPCIGVAAVCPQTPLCASKAVCVPSGQPAYYEIKGTLAGGNPVCASGIVLNSATVNLLALTTGPSLIAGGMGPTLMEGGITASYTGTFQARMIRFYNGLAVIINSLKNLI